MLDAGCPGLERRSFEKGTEEINFFWKVALGIWNFRYASHAAS
jgi:hypothetical protein